MARYGLMVCPDCSKRGVTLRLGAEDWYVCRYCQWAAASNGDYRQDIAGREALRQANPDHPGRPPAEYGSGPD